jgi:hypothetical protein
LGRKQALQCALEALQAGKVDDKQLDQQQELLATETKFP